MNVALPILLIEDDPMVGQSLSRAINDAGMLVDWIRDGVNGLAAIESGRYALILLDLGLPRLPGLEVLKSMRTHGNATPLFIITARDEIDDRVTGLDLGADDYLVKPFSFKELMARIRRVISLNGNPEITRIGNGEITLDLATHKAIYRGKSLGLTIKEFGLLHALIEHPGMILSRNQLQERVYGNNEDIESNVIEVLIHSLRKKFDNEIIRNVRGIGWMVVKHTS